MCELAFSVLVELLSFKNEFFFFCDVIDIKKCSTKHIHMQ